MDVSLSGETPGLSLLTPPGAISGDFVDPVQLEQPNPDPNPDSHKSNGQDGSNGPTGTTKENGPGAGVEDEEVATKPKETDKVVTKPNETDEVATKPKETNEDKMVILPLSIPPKPSQTGEIHRDFAKFAAPKEDFSTQLSESDRVLLASLQTTSPRTERLKRLYDMNGEKDWQNYINDLDDDAVPPLTKFTQKYIYDYQHPETCADKKFLVMNHFDDKNGLGTVIHGIGFVLNLAIRNNRILIYNYTNDIAPGRHFVDPGCQGPNLRSLDCIYEPITSCSWSDVTAENSLNVPAYWNIPQEIRVSSGTIPPLLGAALREIYPDMKPNAMKYWWRTQAAGYIMRMNGPATARMKELRLNTTMHTGFTRNGQTGEVSTVDVPFPLPNPIFSMHVRHGDKGIEMELIPFTAYIDLAERYAAENPLTAMKVAFLSTEDDSIFDEARNISSLMPTSTTSNSDWTWYHSFIPRINGGPKEQLNAFGNRTEMTIKWMQQLIMAVECDTIVGTRGSGWNRMIDELRCVWVDCRKPYLEVGVPEDWV
ncbi:hypothetical protein RUND412_010547 [Rhizina undulata]